MEINVELRMVVMNGDVLSHLVLVYMLFFLKLGGGHKSVCKLFLDFIFHNLNIAQKYKMSLERNTSLHDHRVGVHSLKQLLYP